MFLDEGANWSSWRMKSIDGLLAPLSFALVNRFSSGPRRSLVVVLAG